MSKSKNKVTNRSLAGLFLVITLYFILRLGIFRVGHDEDIYCYTRRGLLIHCTDLYGNKVKEPPLWEVFKSGLGL